MAELRHLRAFVAVAEELSFTRAAQRLHLAQQAVSRSVAGLEAELGVELVRRTTHDVALTAAGEALLRGGGPALAQVDAAFATAAAHGRGLAGRVRVGVTAAVGTAAHPQLAAALTADAPRLQVTFREVRPPEAAELLSHGELDLVVSRTRLIADGLRRLELTPSPAVAVVPAGHRLVGRGRVAAAELDGETLETWAAPGDPYTDELVARLADGGARVQVAVSRVVGGAGPPVLDAGHFALRPLGWPVSGDVAVELASPGFELPLRVHWPPGAVPAAVDRLRRQLGAGA